MHNRTLLVLFALVALSVLFAPTPPAARAAFSPDQAVTGRDLLQFTAGGQALGFQPTGLYLASGSLLLRVEFVDTVGVRPVAATPRAADGRAQPLEPVTYANLWNGITVTFQPVAGGIYKSTYLLAPGAGVAAIHLRYNIPVEIDPSGSLSLHLPTGEYQESAPVAWQDIAGERVPVEVAFQPLAEREIGFHLGPYNPAYPLVLDPTLQWNTFLGSASEDAGTGIAVDASGNIYVVGYSNATWGSPIRVFTGSYETFVAKLSSTGSLVWNTFLGGTGRDFGRDIALDSNNNIYVTGTSEATWGNPKRPYAYDDVFVAKLDNSGALQWNTFLGGGSLDECGGIAIDPSGSIYVAGGSEEDWGSVHPRSYTGGWDGFVAKLGSDGTLLWNSFLGGSNFDLATSVAVDGSGNTYIAGVSSASWGSPVRDFTAGSSDAFVAKLDGGGILQWNTFLGGSAEDEADDVAVDGSGSVNVTGVSDTNWGNAPRRSYSSDWDIFVAQLDSSGALQWNTFLGGSSNDSARALSLDAGSNLIVTGYSNLTWGSPLQAFTGGSDVVVSKLDSSGTLLWNTFLGGASSDFGADSIVDGSGNIVVTGDGYAGWGSPLESFHGTTSTDTFVAVIRKENSTTTLSAHTPSPSLPGQAVTISYTVAANPPINLTPTGLVTVSDGTASCSSTIATGHCDLAFTAAGTKSLTATFAGDTEFSGSASATTAHQVNKANTTTSITGDTPDPSVPGQTVTISYTVSADPPSNLTPTGSVMVGDGAVSCTGTAAAGHCTLTLGTTGTRNLVATFEGDANSNGSTSAGQAHLVSKGNTTTSITGHTPTSSTVGQTYTVTWTVSVTPPAAGTLTGTVTVGDGGAGSCSAAVAIGHCALVSTSPGTKSLTATFVGDDNFSGSTSVAQAHQVNRGNTTTSITGHAPNPSIVGQSYTVTWTVSVTTPGAGTPTGTVTVGDGGAGTCTAPVAEGHCALVSTGPGTKVLTATFSGNSNLNGSSGTASHEVKSSEFRTYLPLLKR